VQKGETSIGLLRRRRTAAEYDYNIQSKTIFLVGFFSHNALCPAAKSNRAGRNCRITEFGCRYRTLHFGSRYLGEIL